MATLDLVQNKICLSRSQNVLASASTFSKVQQFETGETPFCLIKGDGALTWDVDGNEYMDYIIGLGCMTLGHNHPLVNAAIKEQLKNGITFSLPTPLEVEVAEMLIERIPSAEKVKFGKNGNDATSAAVRLSRYHTKKDHILFSGYHGWQDWYISQTSKNGGVPACVGELSHRFIYNDIDSLTRLIKQYKDNVACIIMEPLTARENPSDNFLEKVRDLATRNNIVLVFDEVVTGFRFHRAGAQTLFNVIPDLSCFSKAIANGMPLSVLVGKADIMSEFNDIFVSLTNAGETLSLAATKAVIQFHDQVDVPAYLAEKGRNLKAGLKQLISKYDLSDKMEIIGHDCRSGIIFFKKDDPGYDMTDDLLFWTKLVTSYGILSGGWHFISYAHTDGIIEKTLDQYDKIIGLMKDRLDW